MEGFLISGIQQVGIGVRDVHIAWAWYRKYFGMDVPIFQEAAEAPFMTPYTGGTVQSRTAVLAVNLTGGSGFEIWQYTSRKPEKPAFEIQLGDLGICAARIKCRNVEKVLPWFQSENLEVIGGIRKDPAGALYLFVKDLYGNLFQVIEQDDWFAKGPYLTGGPAGAMIGVSDVDKARKLYTNILGYDQVLYDVSGEHNDLTGMPGGSGEMRRVLLTHPENRKGPFSRLLGQSKIELVQCTDRKPNKIFENRFWGDLGFIHLCFDITGMEELKKICTDKGFPFTVETGDTFDMGEAGGAFSYIEDPDGTLIEFVETHKLPINKKKGKYLDLTKRDPEKPLPSIMLKALRFGRVKD